MKTMKSKLRAFYNQHYFIIASVIAAILVLGCTVYLYTSIGQRIAEFNAGFDGAFSLIWWGAMVFGMLCTPYLALWSWTTVFVPHEVAGCSIVLNLPRTLGGGV